MKVRLGVAAVAAVALMVPAGAGGAGSCSPKLIGQTVHYCGPATAKLSTFSGVTFRKGSCKRTRVNGRPFMTVKLGIRTQDAVHNSGKDNFELSISGPLSSPTGGGVVAYHAGKRWGGRGVSFKGTATGGSFTARGINGSHGTARGSFRCS